MKRLIIIGILSLLIMNCGQNKEENTSSFSTNTEPAIGNFLHGSSSPSNLSEAEPDKLFGDITIDGSIDFVDSDGDIAILQFTIKDGTTVLHVEEIDISKDYQGETKGTIDFSFTATILIIDNSYTLEVIAIDKKGQFSNKFQDKLVLGLTNSGTGTQDNSGSNTTQNTNTDTN
ncbi:MAG: hypothetical protein ACE5EA_07985 [Nitrospirota bacterium]